MRLGFLTAPFPDTPLMDGTSTSARLPRRKSSTPRRSATVSAANATVVVIKDVRNATSTGRPRSYMRAL